MGDNMVSFENYQKYKIYKQVQNDMQRDEGYVKIRRYCEGCGHTIYISKRMRKVICNYCGKPVYYDEKEKFKDKLQKKMRENGRQEN